MQEGNEKEKRRAESTDLGWLAQSSIMPRKRKEIQGENSSVWFVVHVYAVRINKLKTSTEKVLIVVCECVQA